MRVGIGFALLFVVACASAPTPRTYYLMRADVSDGIARIEAPVVIGLRTVEVAPYLSDPGLVLALGGNEVRSARSHLWAEPLSESLRLFLRARISSELGYPLSPNTSSGNPLDYEVDVAVEELHGTLAGTARLVASWQIAGTDAMSEVAAFRFAGTRHLAQDGYAALAEAEIALVGELAAAIANSLRAADIPRPAAAPDSSD